MCFFVENKKPIVATQGEHDLYCRICIDAKRELQPSNTTNSFINYEEFYNLVNAMLSHELNKRVTSYTGIEVVLIDKGLELAEYRLDKQEKSELIAFVNKKTIKSLTKTFNRKFIKGSVKAKCPKCEEFERNIKNYCHWMPNTCMECLAKDYVMSEKQLEKYNYLISKYINIDFLD